MFYARIKALFTRVATLEAGGADSAAIHVDEPDEIAEIADKPVLAADDVMVIESQAHAYGKRSALLSAVAALTGLLNGISSFFTGALRSTQFVTGVIPPTTADVETIRITVPEGENLILTFEGNIASASAGQVQTGFEKFLGTVNRSVDGVLQLVGTDTWQAGTVTVAFQDVVIDGDDIVIRLNNPAANDGSAVVSAAYSILDSAVDIPTD